MRVIVCDICYPKLVEAKYTISIKDRQSEFMLDVCKKHRDWIKKRGDKSVGELNKELILKLLKDAMVLREVMAKQKQGGG